MEVLVNCGEWFLWVALCSHPAETQRQWGRPTASNRRLWLSWEVGGDCTAGRSVFCKGRENRRGRVSHFWRVQQQKQQSPRPRLQGKRDMSVVLLSGNSYDHSKKPLTFLTTPPTHPLAHSICKYFIQSTYYLQLWHAFWQSLCFLYIVFYL